MKVQNKREILDSLAKNSGKLKELGIKRIGLFGSYAVGTQTETSDIDLLVEFDKGKKSFDNFMGTVTFSETLLGRKVEVITPESLSPHIAPYVKQEVEYVKTA
ncbi:MAG: nucleotidyltransferase family protein [Patescibacteria group bacterium]